MIPPKHVLISRTDSIGDVVLTLPMAKALKDAFPGVRVSFLGKAYTKPVIESCIYVDRFVDEAAFKTQPAADFDAILHVLPKPELARRAKTLGIPLRIGTTNRLYHWWTCNRLVRLSRKNSDLHEAQLNLKLLQALGIDRNYDLETIGTMVGMHPDTPLPPDVQALLAATGRPKVILHPKSQGSAREWPLSSYAELTRKLFNAGCTVFISGTASDGVELANLFTETAGIATDITGTMNLAQFMTFIRQADGVVACSTGPLHIAAALGTAAVGIYPPIRPMHPGRWAPVGPKTVALAAQQACDDCRKTPGVCRCMDEVMPDAVADAVLKRL